MNNSEVGLQLQTQKLKGSFSYAIDLTPIALAFVLSKFYSEIDFDWKSFEIWIDFFEYIKGIDDQIARLKQGAVETRSEVMQS